MVIITASKKKHQTHSRRKIKIQVDIEIVPNGFKSYAQKKIFIDSLRALSVKFYILIW